MPEQLAYLWEYFGELGRSRRNYGWGFTSLEYGEIEAWARLRQVTLDPWELETILRLDNAYLSFLAQKANSNDG